MHLLSGLDTIHPTATSAYPAAKLGRGVFDLPLQNLVCRIRAKSVKLSEDVGPESLQQRSELALGSLIITFPSSTKDKGRGILSRVENRQKL